MLNTSAIAFGGQELILVALILVLPGFWLWSLIHCIQNKRLSDTNRIIGIGLIIFLNLIGSFVYLFFPKEQPRS